MKPVIAYGILGSTYAQDWEIIEITSERAGGHRGMVYGRDQHGNPTHRKPYDVHGRFTTREEVELGLAALREIHAGHAPHVEAAENEYCRVMRERNEAVTRALDNIRVTKIA